MADARDEDWPDVHHSERVRACFGQVLGKAGTHPPKNRDQRRTEADDAEQEVSST